LGGSDVYIKLSDSNTYYQPGDTMPGMLDKGLMGEAGEKIMPAVNDILPKLDSILTATNRIMSSEALIASVKNIEVLTEELKTSTKQLNNLITNDVPKITDRVVEIEEDVLAVSSQLSEVDYQNLFATLDSTLNNIQRISAALNESQGTLGLLLNDSALYNNLNSTCEEANKLLEDLREHPKRYVHFSVFGKKDK
jgi:phospholipid/cholesterol/gamma-HCH transport system substrate-binding protein